MPRQDDLSPLPISAQLANAPRPIVALAQEFAAGANDPVHEHVRAQLLYACQGVMSIVTSDGSYVIPPQRALWIPAGMRHRVTFRSDVSLRTLYVAKPDIGSSNSRVIEVSPLLRALILEAMLIPQEYDLNGRDGRIMQLILDSIELMPTAPLSVPMPSDSRLLHICQLIFQDPAREEDLDDWARTACMSRRTLTRRFREETGMSLASWKQYVRLIEGVARLAAGQPVSTVAYEVGYDSPSAFTVAFHRVFGTSPSRYVS